MEGLRSGPETAVGNETASTTSNVCRPGRGRLTSVGVFLSRSCGRFKEGPVVSSVRFETLDPSRPSEVVTNDSLTYVLFFEFRTLPSCLDYFVEFTRSLVSNFTVLLVNEFIILYFYV